LFFGAWNFLGLNSFPAPRILSLKSFQSEIRNLKSAIECLATRTSHPATVSFFLIVTVAEGKLKVAERVSDSKYVDTLSNFM
jgi:hypothetical protein